MHKLSLLEKQWQLEEQDPALLNAAGCCNSQSLEYTIMSLQSPLFFSGGSNLKVTLCAVQ